MNIPQYGLEFYNKTLKFQMFLHRIVYLPIVLGWYGTCNKVVRKGVRYENVYSYFDYLYFFGKYN